jgi:hypothetical protein
VPSHKVKRGSSIKMLSEAQAFEMCLPKTSTSSSSKVTSRQASSPDVVKLHDSKLYSLAVLSKSEPSLLSVTEAESPEWKPENHWPFLECHC